MEESNVDCNLSIQPLFAWVSYQIFTMTEAARRAQTGREREVWGSGVRGWLEKKLGKLVLIRDQDANLEEFLWLVFSKGGGQKKISTSTLPTCSNLINFYSSGPEVYS